MAETIPKKDVLQSAAADSYSKPGAAMAPATPVIARLNETKAEPPKKGAGDGKGRKSR